MRLIWDVWDTLSVKRVEDGEIFSVGDYVWSSGTGGFYIEHFLPCESFIGGMGCYGSNDISGNEVAAINITKIKHNGTYTR